MCQASVLPRREHLFALSIHVEVPFEYAFLECVGLFTLGLGSFGLCCLGRWYRHVGNGLGPIVISTALRNGLGRNRGHGRSEGKRGTGSLDGALGSRSKLLGPVETLVVRSGTSAAIAHSHCRGTETHPARKGRDRSGTAGLVLINGVLIDGVGVGGHASTAKAAEGVGIGWRGASQANARGGDGQTSTAGVGAGGQAAVGCSRVTAEQARESLLGDGATATVVHVGGNVLVIRRHRDGMSAGSAALYAERESCRMKAAEVPLGTVMHVKPWWAEF